MTSQMNRGILLYNLDASMPRRIATVQVYFAFLLTAACSRHAHAPDALAVPVTDRQRSQALEGVMKLRELFNNNSCQTVPEQADGAYRNLSSEEWIGECEQLKTNLGQWKGFEQRWATRCGAPDLVICIGGPARFTRGDQVMDVALRLTSGRAELVWISLKLTDDHWTTIPAFQSPFRLADPPVPVINRAG